jgi:hypothetical protein
MSLEQLMAYAARLSSLPTTPLTLQPLRGPVRAAAPRQPSLSAQEWAELFPDLPARPPRSPRPTARHSRAA